MANSSRVNVNDLKKFVVDCLIATSVSHTDANRVADALATTDAMGVLTHGTKLLAGYLNKLKAHGYGPNASPRIERQGPAWAVVDGDNGLGQIGCEFAVRLAMEKAATTGIAWVGLTNTGHIGAAGYYASLAARQGMMAMVTGNDIPSVAAPGSRQAVLGSNPIAYAIPVANADPILLDMATSAVAGGKVYAACQRGEPIADTWLIGPDGHPTTDGSLYPGQAALAPMAGHKGYGIGLWCEIMSAVLPGGNITWQVGSWIFDSHDKPSQHNASFIVIDVNVIAERSLFDARIKHLIDEIHAAPAADGVERVMLPGEREWAQMRDSIANGIPIPSDGIEKLRIAGEFVGIRPDWLTTILNKK